MVDRVFRVSQLTEDGYGMSRNIFLLMNDDNFEKLFAMIWKDKSIKRTLTTSKEVLYEIL